MASIFKSMDICKIFRLIILIVILAPATTGLSYTLEPAIMFVNDTREIIRFETDIGSNCTVEYGTTLTYGTNISDNTSDRLHEIVIDGLRAGTEYYYGVDIQSGNDTNNEFNASFVTSNRDKTSFVFAVLGDSRPASGPLMPEVFGTLINLIENKNPDFIVMTGDDVKLSDVGIISRDEAVSYWGGFINVTKSIMKTKPFFTAVGNHDRPDQTEALKRFQEVFLHPHNGNGEMGYFNETTYWFEYGNSLFVVLNTEEPNYTSNIGGNQLTWLNETIRRTGYTHKFVFTHRPIRGSTRKTMINANLIDSIFWENNVTAIFAGHNHLYCYYTTHDNLLYITAGGAGAKLHTRRCAGTGISTHHYVLVSVTNNTIIGTVYDASDIEIANFSRSIQATEKKTYYASFLISWNLLSLPLLL